MTGASSAEMQRLLAAAFERAGWKYDLTTPSQIVAEAQDQGLVDPERLASRVASEFLSANDASREDLADLIRSALGGRVPRRDPEAVQLVVNNNHFTVGPGGSVTNSSVNVGSGTQITVDADSGPEDLLAAVEALVRSGLGGSWNGDAARELSTVLDRDDAVTFEDIERLTISVIEAQRPTRQRARDFLRDVAAGGVGGVLSTGISAGVGQLLQTLPG